MYLCINLHPAVFWNEGVGNWNSLVDWNALADDSFVFHTMQRLLLPFESNDLILGPIHPGFKAFLLGHAEHTIDFGDAQPMKNLDEPRQHFYIRFQKTALTNIRH